MSRWALLALALLGCRDEAGPPHAEYCFEAPEGPEEGLRVGAYWEREGGALEVIVDQPLSAGRCLQITPPRAPSTLSGRGALEVGVYGWQEPTPWLSLEAYSPILLLYMDLDGDRRFTPYERRWEVVDQILGFNAGQDVNWGRLAWVRGYEAAVEALRDGRTPHLFFAQPEPGVPFIYSDYDSSGARRAAPFKRVPLDLSEAIDPWCAAERRLSECGARLKPWVEHLETHGTREVWHAPTLRWEVRDEAHLDEDYPDEDRFAFPEGQRVWGTRFLDCWSLEGVAIAERQHAYAFAARDACACDLVNHTVLAAAPADHLPAWWPCAPGAPLTAEDEGYPMALSAAQRAGLDL